MRRRLKQVVKGWIRWGLRFPPAWLVFVLLLRLRWTLVALYCGLQRNRRDHASVFNFRRNIHRLEKGLSFPEGRPVFAEDYILETVRLFATADAGRLFDPITREWGTAVLDRYFKSVDQTPVIARALAIYRDRAEAPQHPDWVPYPARWRPPLRVTYDDLLALAQRRRSIRFYLDRPVASELIERAIEVALLSPSSCNRQAFRFLYYDRPDLVAALAQVPGGVAGYSVPTVIVVVGRYRAYFDERDFKAPLVDASLASMALLFALETLGLASVCINWPSKPEPERSIRRLIELEPDEFVVMLIGVGYADPEGKVPFSAKLEGLLEINRRMVKR